MIHLIYYIIALFIFLTSSYASDSTTVIPPYTQSKDMPIRTGTALGSIENVTQEDCAFYRNGRKIVELDIAVYRLRAKPGIADHLVPGIDSTITYFDWTKIYFPDEYVNKDAKNFLPMTIRKDGTYPPENGGLFRLDIETGEPEKDGVTNRNGFVLSPMKYTHFNLLASAKFYERTPENIIDIYSHSKNFTIEDYFSGYLDDGYFIRTRKLNYILTKNIFFGFQEILIPEKRFETGDFYIRSDLNGEVESVLNCNKLEQYPNPQCNLYEKVGIFAVSAGFNRSQVSHVNQIRYHARRFVACLTVPVKAPQ